MAQLAGYHPWQVFTRMQLKSGAYVLHGELVLVVSEVDPESAYPSLLPVHYYLRLGSGRLKPMEQLEFTARLMAASVTTAATSNGSNKATIYIAPYATPQPLELVVSLALGISPT